MSTPKTNPTPKETPANPAITAMPDADPIQILTDDHRLAQPAAVPPASASDKPITIAAGLC